MSEKFKYAPGKPGYGTKGDRGEDGQQGLAMYFTSLNPNTQTTIINNKIANNLTLWPADEPLPDSRVYVTGDLFFDSDGLAYEINAETDTYQYKFASLNMGGFFVPLGKDTSNGFERYFNSNSSPKFIIDNVYTLSGTIDYTAVPENIYDILPKNFARIEYTNIKSDPVAKYNAFTVYSSAIPPELGGIPNIENNKALAIVYNEAEKSFHIGNLDNIGYLRNTNLIFDVSLLRQKKELGKNTFTQDTCVGAILTNYEIAANSLFDPNFDANPSTFVGVLGTTNASVSWVLSDFVSGDTGVNGDLYFYQNLGSYTGKTFSISDASLRPLIFPNVPASGSVKITCPSMGAYSFYMKVYKNGWIRNSDTKNLFAGTVSVVPTTLNNEPSIAHYLSDPSGFNVIANASWDVSFGSASWITNVSTYYDPITYDGSIRFGFTENTGTDRGASMKVTVYGGASQIVPISQKGGIVPVSVAVNQTYENCDNTGPYLQDWREDVEGSINITGMPPSNVFSMQIYGYTSNHYWGMADYGDVTYSLIVRKNGTPVITFSGTINNMIYPSNQYYANNNTWWLHGLTTSDSITYEMYSECVVPDPTETSSINIGVQMNVQDVSVTSGDPITVTISPSSDSTSCPCSI